MRVHGALSGSYPEKVDRKKVGPRGKRELGAGVERLGRAVVQGCQAVLM